MPKPKELSFPLSNQITFRLNDEGRVEQTVPNDTGKLIFTKQEHRQLRDFLTVVLRREARRSRRTSTSSSRRTRSTAR